MTACIDSRIAPNVIQGLGNSLLQSLEPFQQPLEAIAGETAQGMALRKQEKLFDLSSLLCSHAANFYDTDCATEEERSRLDDKMSESAMAWAAVVIGADAGSQHAILGPDGSLHPQALTDLYARSLGPPMTADSEFPDPQLFRPARYGSRRLRSAWPLASQQSEQQSSPSARATDITPLSVAQDGNQASDHINAGMTALVV